MPTPQCRPRDTDWPPGLSGLYMELPELTLLGGFQLGTLLSARGHSRSSHRLCVCGPGGSRWSLLAT